MTENAKLRTAIIALIWSGSFLIIFVGIERMESPWKWTVAILVFVNVTANFTATVIVWRLYKD